MPRNIHPAPPRRGRSTSLPIEVPGWLTVPYESLNAISVRLLGSSQLSAAGGIARTRFTELLMLTLFCVASTREAPIETAPFQPWKNAGTVGDDAARNAGVINEWWRLRRAA